MKPEAVKCPMCGGAMVSRTNRQTGQRFWGCADYPRCKGSRNTDGESPAEARARKWNEVGECHGYDDNDLADTMHPGHPSNYGDH